MPCNSIIFLEYVLHLNPLCTTYILHFVTLIIVLGYVDAHKPSNLHQHKSYTCYFMIALGMLVPQTTILHHIQVKIDSRLSCNLTMPSIEFTLQYKYLVYFG
jgi:hypothetical protein